jgi:hypothetical protein
LGKIPHLKEDMPQYFAEAERMLGVTDNKIFGPADHMLKKMGDAVGVGHTFNQHELQPSSLLKVNKAVKPILILISMEKVQIAQPVLLVAAV